MRSRFDDTFMQRGKMLRAQAQCAGDYPGYPAGFCLQQLPLFRERNNNSPLVLRVALATNDAHRFQPLEQRGEGSGIKIKLDSEFLYQNAALLPEAQHD